MARSLLVAAALDASSAIPGSSGAGDPWLRIETHPPSPYLLAAGTRRDAVVSIDARNTTDRTVRVAKVRVSYFVGADVVGIVDPADAVFVEAGLDADPRVEALGHEVWRGLCLEPPSTAVDRAELALDLVQRRGWRTTHATQIVDIPLHVPGHPLPLALPVRGLWRVAQGHACDSQHRRGRFGEEFAWDLVAINTSGRSVRPPHDVTHRNADTETFGRPVLSPISGRVVEAVDGLPDNEGITEFPRRSLVDEARDPKWVFGNHLVIDAGGDAYVLLAHLRKGSLAVARGDSVGVGERLAAAGNSGNTVEPHLHLQVMDRPDAADPGVAGLPALFTDYVEIAPVGGGKNGEAARRHVASGDPALGVVLDAR